MTETIFVAAPAKLTLSLRMTGLRDDGFHLIDAEMVTLDLVDTLAITPRPEGETGTLTVEGGGDDIPTGPGNLVNKALVLAGRAADVHLTKRIPSQAGLGGGSSDAGAILRWAGFEDAEAAAGIGADVAFCMIGGRARVQGIGEMLTPMPFEERTLTIVTPPLPCSTPAVYKAWDELGGPRHDATENDLEPAALLVAPGLEAWRDELWEATGIRPTLAGSGSTWFVPGAHPGEGRTVVHTTPAGWEPGS